MMGSMELGLIVLFFGSGLGLPLGVPPQAVDVAIEKAAPDHCLAYISWVESGEPNASSTNRLEKLLADAEIRQLGTVLWKYLDDAMKNFADRDKTKESVALAALVTQGTRQLLKGPGALYLASFQMQPGGFEIDAGLMLGVGDSGPQYVRLIDQFLSAITRAPPNPVKIEGTTFHRVVLGQGIPSLTWGLHRNYLLFGVGDAAIANSLQRTKTAVPGWLTQVNQQLPVKKRSTLAYVNVKEAVKLLLASVPDPDVATGIAASGLEKVTHFAAISGFDGEDTIVRSVLGINGKRTGFFAVPGNHSLELKDLQRIPANAVMAVALRLNAEESVNAFVETMTRIEPRAGQEIEEGFEEIARELNGLNIKRDLLPSLGDVWTAYATADNGSFATGWVFTVRVKDHAAAGRGLQQIGDAIRREGERDRQRGRPEALRKLEVSGEQVYYLGIPDDDAIITPAWCLRKDEFVFTLFPQAMRSYLKRKSTARSLNDLPQVAALFQADRSPTFVQYTDTRELFKWVYPLVQIGMNAMFQQMQRSGLDVDASILPTAGSIQPLLASAVSAGYFQEDGIYMDVRQSVPGVGTGMLWVQTMMFFTVRQRAFMREMEVQLPVEERDVIVPRR